MVLIVEKMVSEGLPQEAVIRGYEAVVYCLAACLLQITWIVSAQLMIWIQQYSRRVTSIQHPYPLHAIRYTPCSPVPLISSNLIL